MMVTSPHDQDRMLRVPMDWENDGNHPTRSLAGLKNEISLGAAKTNQRLTW